MADFEFSEQPLLSRSAIDRAGELRDDEQRLASGWAHARVLLIDAAGRHGVTEGGINWVPGADLGAAVPADAVFLGVRAGTDLWALRVEEISGHTADLRTGATYLNDDDAGLVATALGIVNWHGAARYSPVDGHRTEPIHAGWVRRNIETGRDEFPRTDPAIIAVVHDGADHVLLGRHSGWPPRWYSTFAGFVEPGESLEQCVVRELHEETGIDVCEPRYLGSQPWPFPRSLMLGFSARADRNQPVKFLDGEISEAIWFPRAEVLEALAAGNSWTRAEDAGTDDPDGPRLRLPGSVSISHQLVSAWANARP